MVLLKGKNKLKASSTNCLDNCYVALYNLLLRFLYTYLQHDHHCNSNIKKSEKITLTINNYKTTRTILPQPKIMLLTKAPSQCATS